MKVAVVACALVAACDRRPPITSCRQQLGGEYVVADQRWMVLDHGTTLEVYPLFADVPVADKLEVAPRVIDLEREGDREDTVLAGFVRRRYLRGAAACTVKTPARVTACTDDTLDIVLADPPPPIGFEPCAFGTAAPSRRERWRHD